MNVPKGFERSERIYDKFAVSWSEKEIEAAAKACWEYAVDARLSPWDGGGYERAVWRTGKIEAFKAGLAVLASLRRSATP